MVDQNGQGAVAALLRRSRRRAVTRLPINAEQRSEEWRRLSDVIAASGKKRLQSIQTAIGVVFRRESRCKSELLDNRVKGGLRIVG